MWGSSNIADLVAKNSGYHYGAKFELGSNGNLLLAGTIQATTPVVDYGTNNVIQNVGSGSSSMASVLPSDSVETNHSTTGTAAAVMAAEVALQEDLLESLLLALSAQAVNSNTSTTSPLEGILENRRSIALDIALSELGPEETMFPISNAVR